MSRYDSVEWTSYTAEDGLANEMILALAGDREGGLSRYSLQGSWSNLNVAW